jgi:DNA end-binding protein Ku
MPRPRPYWKGYIKLALVSCPIALYTASSSSERVAFRQINKKTGNRVRQQLVDEVTRDTVEGSDKGRGYEYAKNTYLMIEDEDLDAIAIESNHTIEIDSFVPRSEIDERYLDSPYYIAPNEPVGPGSLRSHPRGNARQEHGGAWPRRPVQARARHHASAVGQRHHGNNDPLPL